MGYNAPRDATYTFLEPPVAFDPIYFTRLLPGADGTGDYHANLHICYFSIDVGDLSKDAKEQIAWSLTKQLSDVENFCSIFSHHNIASAAPGKEGHSEYKDPATMKVHRTVEFVAGGNFGDVDHKLAGLIHPDWVAMSADESTSTKAIKSFHGDTLKRKWRTEFEKSADIATHLSLVALLASLSSGPYALLITAFYKFLANAAVDKLIEINQQHFLAGTRSWRVGYDDTYRAFFMETMAVERFSDLLYEKPDGVAFDYHDGIRRTWANLLNNYINLTTYKCHDFIAVKPPPPPAQAPYARPPYEANWSKYGKAKEINPHVRFKEASFKSVDDLRKSASADALWARQALKNHHGLWRHVY